MATYSDLTPGTWTIDASHSTIGFTARHLMVTKVRGSFHDYSGAVVVAEPVENSKVDVTIQIASVDTKDEGRDNHLRSGDFFDAEAHPTMTFTSTSFDGDKLTGDLTIKGITKPVVLDVDFEGVVTDPWGNEKAGFEAETEINRKDWGLDWNATLEAGGVLVSEKIKINLDLQLAKA
ncbi:YceI family protein [Kribbia dieselivorans]|uniref:YceI family protein n=1 Tax=Kribbia dieselivorans TaxID=331526 RepID=UPI000838AA7E|nr:YceI family protein [Kribbia dieselivorans]